LGEAFKPSIHNYFEEQEAFNHAKFKSLE